MKNFHIQLVFFGSEHIKQAISDRLPAQSGIRLLASTNSIPLLFSILERYNPPLLLLENTDQPTDIIQLVQKIHAQYPQMKFLILAHKVNIPQIETAIHVGVLGYLIVEASLEGLETAICLVHSGKMILSSPIIQALFSPK
jgi:DNA-binding NarL/FixJ family response regulator